MTETVVTYYDTSDGMLSASIEYPVVGFTSVSYSSYAIESSDADTGTREVAPSLSSEAASIEGMVEPVVSGISLIEESFTDPVTVPTSV